MTSQSYPNPHSKTPPLTRRSVLKYMASAAAACPTCMPVATAMASEQKAASAVKPSAKASHGDNHWGYRGDTGPGHWGEMNAGNKVCSLGFQQSPVDLRGLIPASPGAISVDYRPSTLHVVNNGHTIQCNTDDPGRLQSDPPAETASGTAVTHGRSLSNHPSHLEKAKNPA